MAVYGPSIRAELGGMRKAIYRDFLIAALAGGKYKPAPEPEAIGMGIEYLQAGIDWLRKGVSGRNFWF